MQNEGGILPAAQTLFLGPDSNHDGIPDSEQDSDGDGIPDSTDTDKNGNGVPDDQEDDDGDGIANGQDPDKNGNGIPDDQEGDVPTECVGLICFPAGYRNVTVRTFWTQRSLD